MKKLWTSIMANKSLLLFVGIIFLFGILSGVFFYFQQDATFLKAMTLNLQNLFQTNVFDLKSIFYHFVILAFLIVLLFLFLAGPFCLLVLFLEGVSMGFLIPVFLTLYHLKGIFVFLVYFLLIKSVYLLLLFLLFVQSIRFFKQYIRYFHNKNYSFLKKLKQIVFLVLFVLFNDFLVFFVSNPILIYLFS